MKPQRKTPDESTNRSTENQADRIFTRRRMRLQTAPGVAGGIAVQIAAGEYVSGSAGGHGVE